MSILSWALSSEAPVGRGHATLPDTVNRPLRQLLTASGYDPDADVGNGFAKGTHTHAAADITDLATASTGITKLGTVVTGVWAAGVIGAAFLGAHTHAWSQVTATPSTIAGYGISDAYTQGQVNTLLSGKAGVATTLAGYGITDALANSGAIAGSLQYGQAGGGFAKRTLTAGSSISITENAGAATVTIAVTSLPWASVTGAPGTLAGYGIADAYTQAQVNTLLAGKVSPATTLAGYGIADAYTKSTVDASFAALNASSLTSGTIPAARFPGTFPAADGSALTNLAAANLAGTIASARIAGSYAGITAVGTLAALSVTGTVTASQFAGALAWSNVTGAPTTLSAYGIADTYTKVLGDARYGVIVASSAARDAAYPAPATDMRVFNKGTGNVERYNGTSWVTDVTGSGGLVREYHVGSFGARSNGVNDDTVAVQAASDAASVTGGLVIFPSAPTRTTSRVRVRNHGVVWQGTNGRTANVQFDNTVADGCVEFKLDDTVWAATPLTLTNCGIRNIRFTSSTTTQKLFALRYVDVSQFHYEDVQVHYSWQTWAVTGNASIGIESMGREYVTDRNCLIYADRPFVCSQNPRDGGSGIDLDMYTSEGGAFVGPDIQYKSTTGTVTVTAGVAAFSSSQAGSVSAGGNIVAGGLSYNVITFNGTNSATLRRVSDNSTTFSLGTTALQSARLGAIFDLVYIDPTVRSFQKITFKQKLFALGAGAINWSGAGATQGVDGFVVDGCRQEQNQNCNSYFVKIARDAFLNQGISIEKSAASFTQHGLYFRQTYGTRLYKYKHATIDPTLKVIDIDGTNGDIGWRGCDTQAGGGSSIVGLFDKGGKRRWTSLNFAIAPDADYDSVITTADYLAPYQRPAANMRTTLPASGVEDTYLADDATRVKRRYFTGREVHEAGISVGPEATSTIITQIRIYAVTLTPTSVAANTSGEQSFTVTGLDPADTITVHAPGITVGTIVGAARCNVTDNLKVVFGNLTAGALTPQAGTYRVKAFRS